MRLTPQMLPLFNLYLAAHPDLGAKIDAALVDLLALTMTRDGVIKLVEAAQAKMGQEEPTNILVDFAGPDQGPIPQGPEGPQVPKVEALAVRVLTFLQQAGESTPADIKARFKDENPKLLTRATARLVDTGRAHWNQLKGQGSKYQAVK